MLNTYKVMAFKLSPVIMIILRTVTIVIYGTSVNRLSRAKIHTLFSYRLVI